MTHATVAGRDVAVLYGGAGTDGETVLHYSAQPTVVGAVKTTWDAAKGDLRLNYTHTGLQRVLVNGPGAAPLLLLIGDKAAAATFWQDGNTIVRGTHLLRGATGGALSGDNGTDPAIEVFTGASAITWNGAPVTTTA